MNHHRWNKREDRMRLDSADGIVRLKTYFHLFSPWWWRMTWCERRTEKRGSRWQKDHLRYCRFLQIDPHAKMEMNHEFPDDSRMITENSCCQCKIYVTLNPIYAVTEIATQVYIRRDLMKCMCEFIFRLKKTLGWQSDKASCNVTCSLNMQATF